MCIRDRFSGGLIIPYDVNRKHGIYRVYMCGVNRSSVDLMLSIVVQAKMRFVELVYVLATEEAERIGVDHVARVSAGDAREGSMGKLSCGGSVSSSLMVEI